MVGIRIARLLLVAGALSSCGKTPVSSKDTQASESISVKVVRVEESSLTPEIDSFGNISYRSKADISTAVDGTVKHLAVEEGDRVREGEILSVLDNVQLIIRKSQAESQLRVAEAAVELAEAQLADGRRQVEARILSLEKTRLDIARKNREVDELSKTLAHREKLLEVNGIADEQVRQVKLQYESAVTSYKELLNDYAVRRIGLRDQDIRSAGYSVPSDDVLRIRLLIKINTETLQAQLDSTAASVESAKSNLEAARVHVDRLTTGAPVSGIVGARQASVGEQLRAGDKIFSIMDDTQVYAVFPVPERGGMTLSVGMPVKVTVPALNGRRYDARISIIAPQLDPQSGNLTVKSLVANRDGSLKPGLFVRVTIQTATTRPAILLPESVFTRNDGSNGDLFVVRDGHAFKRRVEIRRGNVGKGRIEVVKGLRSGEEVVDEPSPVLQDGGGVHVQG